jgi:hypothetical protein
MFPEFASQLSAPCTRGTLGKMLRSRQWRLEVSTYTEDQGFTRVFMADRWSDPQHVQIGMYGTDASPDWAAMYDAAMAYHLSRLGNRFRRHD